MSEMSNAERRRKDSATLMNRQVTALERIAQALENANDIARGHAPGKYAKGGVIQTSVQPLAGDNDQITMNRIAKLNHARELNRESLDGQ